MKKRGQITIFIIVGVVVIVSILTVVFLRSGINSQTPKNLGPKQFIHGCVEDLVEGSLEKVLIGGGKISPELTLQYLDESYNYLCYQGDNHLGCYNLYPLLEKLIAEEIENDTKQQVGECFELLEEDFSERGYSINNGSENYSIELLPGKIKISLKKKIDISKTGESQSFENFDSEVLSPIYEMVGITRKIINDESTYCNFDYIYHMSLYPQDSIRRISYSGNKIYYILDRNSGKEFKFAIRGCTQN